MHQANRSLVINLVAVSRPKRNGTNRHAQSRERKKKSKSYIRQKVYTLLYFFFLCLFFYVIKQGGRGRRGLSESVAQMARRSCTISHAVNWIANQYEWKKSRKREIEKEKEPKK